MPLPSAPDLTNRVAIITGAIFGLTFGILDIEDQLVRSPRLFREALHREVRRPDA